MRLSGVSAGGGPPSSGRPGPKAISSGACPRPLDRLPGQCLGPDGDLAIFVRTAEQWEQTARWEAAATLDGRVIELDTSSAAGDGDRNVLVIALDSGHSSRLLFDAKGLPGESFFLDLEGRAALTESFTLLCETLDRDGKIRPALWRYVEDLYACGPRDRVFTYDAVRETVTFGDGEHGALLSPGTGAVLARRIDIDLWGRRQYSRGDGADGSVR